MTGNNDLPLGWVKLLVGELATEINPGFPSGKHNQSEIGVPHLRPMNISALGNVDLSVVKYVEETEYDPLKEGDVLFNNTNSPKLLGKTTLIPHDTNWAYSNHMTRIRVDKNKVSPAWLAYYLLFLFYNGFFRMHCTHHVNQASINSTFLSKNVEIPIPPRHEQERIVARIEETFTQLEAGVAELRNAKAQLKRYRAAVLKSAVEGELTREWREARQGEIEPAEKLLARILEERRKKWDAEGRKGKYKEPAAPNMDEMPGLPEGWVWATLPQLGELNRGKSKHRPRNAPELYGGTYPFVQTGDVRHANGIIREYSQTYSEEGLAQSRLWPAGTLCITIAANIADTAILGFDACFPDSVVGFLCDPNHCNVKYVELFLRTAKQDLERYAPATAQKNINLRILSELAIPLPPLKEQNMFVDKVERRLSVADEIEKELDESLVRAERLRGSILKNAFEGKL